MDSSSQSSDSDDVKTGKEFDLKDYKGENVTPEEPTNKGEEEKQIYVDVKGSEDGKPRGLPCNSDKNLSLATLSHSFPGATGLEFKDPKTEAIRVVMFDPTRSLFICSADGWKNKIFTATYPTAPPPPPPPQPRVIRIKLMDEGIVVVERKVSLSGNVITQKAVKNMFSLALTSVVKLRYGDNEEAKWCNLDSTGSFLLPEGWPNMEFFVDSRLEGPANNTNRVSKILEIWQDRVFLIQGRRLVGSGVLIDQQRILTTAHLSFKLGDMYQVKGKGPRNSFAVCCEFICKEVDVAVLNSLLLPKIEMSTENLKRGSKYFLMGYPMDLEKDEPTITKGIIEGKMKDGGYLVGTRGSKRGYSGAPVFDDSGKLAGLLLGGTAGFDVDTSIQELLKSSEEQKYAKILGIDAIKACQKIGKTDRES